MIVSNAAAAAAQSVGRAQYYRIADDIGEFLALPHRVDHFGSRNGFMDLFHSIFKFLAVLRLADGFRGSTDQSYVMFL